MKRIAAASLPLIALALTGCGGSGTAADPSTSGLPAGTARAETAAATAEAAASAAPAPFTPIALTLTGTDTATPTWSHVWATIHAVEGITSDEKTISLFQSGEGLLVDLTAPFPLIGAGVAGTKVPSLRRLRLTLQPSLQVMKPGQDTAETVALGPSLPRDATGRSVATLTLNKPYEGTAPLALAVDLKQLTIAEGKAGLLLSVADAPTTPQLVTVIGAVRDKQFVTASGGRLDLKTDAATVVVNADGSPSPKFVEATRATVTGLLSPDAKTLTAQRIALGTPESAQLQGAVTEVDTKLGTFILSASAVSGLLPTRLTTTVTLAESAVLRGRGGLVLTREAFLSALAEKGTSARIEGVYEPVAGTFTARRAQLLGEGPHTVRWTGTAVIEAKTGALTLGKPLEWDGFVPGETAPVLVTNAATTFVDEKDAALTRADFLTALNEHSVQVIGLLSSDGKLTATRLRIGAPVPKPEPEKKPETEKKAPATPDPKGT